MPLPTLILDAMGADLGSAEMVRGAMQAIAAAKEPFRLLLITGEPESVEREYAAQLRDSCHGRGCETEVLHAAQTLPKDIESPLEAFKRFPDCSINVAMRAAKDCENCAVISPGTTGLVMTSALFTLGRVRGIDRSPIGTPMPTLTKDLFYVDGGSNVDCKPAHLYQFAVLAHIYLKNIVGVQHPSIALLSNGSEDYKGNAVIKEAYTLLEADRNLNFVGYTEGHTMLDGNLDIMVCDGFIGNILLKFAEGVAEMMVTLIRQNLQEYPLAGLAAKLFQRPAFRRVRDKMDYAHFGGAPLLGLNGNVVICHGRSSAVAIKNALAVGYQLAQAGIAQQVAQYVQNHDNLHS